MTKGREKVFALAVVGTGIHGLHLATSAVETGIVSPENLLLLDRYPENLFLWDRRVRNCCMDYLRSPASHGLDPRFPALRRLMRDPGDWTDPYHRPSVPLFRRHGEDRIRRFLGGAHRITGEVTAIDRDDSSPGRPFRVALRPEGTDRQYRSYRAAAVILAPGMAPPCIPGPFQGLPVPSDGVERVLHVHEVRFDPHRIQAGEEILVVGGGIAALHLLPALAERQCSVTLWRRDPITVHQFDSDPCFIGPRCSGEMRRAGTDEERIRLLRRNRRPGSVPPDLYRRYREDLDRGRYSERELQVTEAEVIGARVCVRGTAAVGTFDRVILCTGFADEPPARGLVKTIAERCSAPLAEGGYPRAGEDLAWIPGLYVTGGLADLVIGPPAKNIIGAHLARRRILPALRRIIR